MNDFLQTLVDFLAVLFGDTPDRPRAPKPLPPALPPAPPPVPRADPDEPQDGTELDPGDNIVVSHEGEPVPEGKGPEFDENPMPVPDDITPVPTGEIKPEKPVTPSPEYRARYLWCIDNGHGALSPGKRSPELPDGGGRLFEYEWNRDVSARIFRRLDEIGVAYFNVTPEVQIGNFLTERVERANRLSSSLPKLFVSIHANAGPAASLDVYTDDDIRGIETWHYYGSTTGRRLAAVFQRHLIEQTSFRNRHLRSKVTGQFYVLRATRMPAILTENGFYNNRFELPIMVTEAFKDQVAEAHVQAILEVDRLGLD